MLENQYFGKEMGENLFYGNKILFSNTSDYLGFFMLILVQFIPLLFGLLIKLILEPFAQNINKNTVKKSEGVDKMDGMKSLSSREIEVAKLAAKGYSNMEIAEELFISVETVKRHLSTIFDKLNIKSRKEIKSSICNCGDNS